MKIFPLVLIGFLFLGCVSVASIQDPNIVKIIETNKNKEDAFNISMRWMTDTFVSAKSVIEYSDKSSGIINGKGSMLITGPMGRPVELSFLIIIDIKDNRTRISYRALHASASSGARGDEIPVQVFEKFKIKVVEMTTNYQNYLNTKYSDW